MWLTDGYPKILSCLLKSKDIQWKNLKCSTVQLEDNWNGTKHTQSLTNMKIKVCKFQNNEWPLYWNVFHLLKNCFDFYPELCCKLLNLSNLSKSFTIFCCPDFVVLSMAGKKLFACLKKAENTILLNHLEINACWYLFSKAILVCVQTKLKYKMFSINSTIFTDKDLNILPFFLIIDCQIKILLVRIVCANIEIEFWIQNFQIL